jgi:hypothetical protein
MLVGILRDARIPARTDTAEIYAVDSNDGRPEHLRRKRIHGYCVLQENPDLIADPTWQQFLLPEQRKPNVPKMLVGQRSDVMLQARSYGISDPVVLSFWLTLTQRRYVRYRRNN